MGQQFLHNGVIVVGEGVVGLGAHEADFGLQGRSYMALEQVKIDGQVVMQKLHISARTLQTLRSNGTIPYTKIGHKIWYLKRDLERVLRNNYVMFNIRERYGESD